MLSFKSKLSRLTRLRVVMLLLVMIMTTLVVSKSAKAATQLSTVSCVAAGHHVNSGDEIPDSAPVQDDDSSEFGDSLVDLEDVFPAQFHFAISDADKITHPRVDLTLELPPHTFSFVDPDERA